MAAPAHAADRAAADGSTPEGVAGPLAWLGLMALLVAGFALMGAAFSNGNGWVFGSGLVVSGLAFVIPLATGHHER